MLLLFGCARNPCLGAIEQFGDDETVKKLFALVKCDGTVPVKHTPMLGVSLVRNAQSSGHLFAMATRVVDDISEMCVVSNDVNGGSAMLTDYGQGRAAGSSVILHPELFAALTTKSEHDFGFAFG